MIFMVAFVKLKERAKLSQGPNESELCYVGERDILPTSAENTVVFYLWGIKTEWTFDMDVSMTVTTSRGSTEPTSGGFLGTEYGQGGSEALAYHRDWESDSQASVDSCSEL